VGFFIYRFMYLPAHQSILVNMGGTAELIRPLAVHVKGLFILLKLFWPD